MTDKEFQKLITKCREALDMHKQLLRLAEIEYVSRFGNHPSEVNDDWWIDALHYGVGDIGLDKIKENADFNKSINLKTKL